MAETTYTYTISTDFSAGGVNAETLDDEIRASSIVTALERVDVTGDSCDVIFKDALSVGDKTSLDNDATGPAGGLIASHDNAPSISPDPKLNTSGVLYMVPQPQTIGLEMCDRDILIKTATFDATAALAINGADANGHVTYSGSRPGIQGNDVTIAHVVGATGGGEESRALAVAVTPGLTHAVVVTFGTDGSGGSITPTATAVADLVNADTVVAEHLTAVAGGTGASTAGTQAATALAGGTSGSVEDVKINPTTYAKSEWKELVQVGVYKDDSGNYVPCTDQTDAGSNAILSVWKYCAHSHVTGLPVAIEVRDGLLNVDAATSSSLEHLAFAIAAPRIPASFGGSIVQFDAYLKYHVGEELGATSPAAKALDPYGPGGTAGAELWVYVYYPAGTQNNHVLRLVTYRPAGTF